MIFGEHSVAIEIYTKQESKWAHLTLSDKNEILRQRQLLPTLTPEGSARPGEYLKRHSGLYREPSRKKDNDEHGF